jgi:hypothetical protein
VQRTPWRVRCAQPPYDRLPTPRAAIPAGIILSREGDAWVKEGGIEDVALPLYEGRMISAFDFAFKGWMAGSGLAARWKELAWSHKAPAPQYLIGSKSVAQLRRSVSGLKVAYRNIARNTDSRSFIGTILVGDPTPHMVSNLVLRDQDQHWDLAAVVNSFTFDYVVRLRLVGTHLDEHLVKELPIPVTAWIPVPGEDHAALLERFLAEPFMTSGSCPTRILRRSAWSMGSSSARPTAISRGSRG